MRAAVFNGPRSIEVGDRPDPVIQEPTDAVVRVVLACVCGSDLWYYRGESPHAVGSIGHEFIGVVEDIGAEVTASPRATSSSRRSSTATCRARTAGTGRRSAASPAALRRRRDRRRPRRGGARPARRQHPRPGARLRSLRADAALAARPVRCHVHGPPRRRQRGRAPRATGRGRRRRRGRSLRGARVEAARRRADHRAEPQPRPPTARAGVRRDRHRRPPRRRRPTRPCSSSPAASASTPRSNASAPVSRWPRRFAIARPGSTIGIVGVPHGVDVPFGERSSATSAGAAARSGAASTSPSSSTTCSAARSIPDRVFDYETDLDHIADAYAAMDERRAIKSLVRVGSL